MEGQFLVLALAGLALIGVLIASFGVEIPPADVKDDEHLTQGRSRRRA